MFATAGTLVTLATAGYLSARLKGKDRRIFLPGETSYGHYQIELSCDACHDVGMGVKEQSCIDCHGAALTKANDSHPKSKFTDPRNADRVALLDARKCVTCHREHQPSITREMGVTLPMDYCYYCHQQTLTDRPSHKNFKFDSCATAGCHNFHDNTALYEDFLVKHADEPDFKEPAVRPARGLRAYLEKVQPKRIKPALKEADADARAQATTNILQSWVSTAHAKAGVNCNDCHLTTSKSGATKVWVDRPSHSDCARCHRDEDKGFLEGHHGMRLAQGLSPMTPAMARLPMKPEAANRELTCAACHTAHEFDTRSAAVDSCLTCHDDEHSKNYKASPHFALWQSEMDGQGMPGSGVSCATCHLPGESEMEGDVTRVLVQHNQSDNLRPNEKMIRSVCLDCHGLRFSIDSLADRELIKNNFNDRPKVHIESIDLAMRRKLEKQKKPTNP